jgi:hypothetical protein
MFVYKYLNKKHLLEFKNKGLIRIGTLYEFRSAEDAVRDEFEGLSRLRVDPKKEPSSFSNEQAHKLFPQIQFEEGITKDAITVMPKAHVISDRQVPDAFVFCTSLKLDKRLNKKWNYDAYYRIIDPFQFAKIAFQELGKQVPLISYKSGKVKYTDKEISITNRNKDEVLSNISNNFWDICFTKPEKFKDEKELRFVFVPAPGVKKIEPRFLTCLELRKCCQF